MKANEKYDGKIFDTAILGKVKVLNPVKASRVKIEVEVLKEFCERPKRVKANRNEAGEEIGKTIYFAFRTPNPEYLTKHVIHIDNLKK